MEVVVEPNDAIEGLFREESAKLWRSLFLHTGDRELARDSVAEAFAQLLGHTGTVRDPKAWVWKTSFRIATGQRAPKVVVTDLRASYELGDPLIDLIEALKALPPMQRRTVILYHLADKSTAEVARVLGTSKSAVGVHLFRGRRKLRELLEVHDDQAD